jgi:hypothetical protein
MNPEALRFPSDLRIKILIVTGVAIDLLFAAAVHFASHAGLQVLDGIVLLLFVPFKLACWPREIVVDQFGIHSLGLFARWNTHIPWDQFGRIYASTEVPGFGPIVLGLSNDALVFEPKDGAARVVHTSHHSDRDRLIRETRLRGVTVDETALT